MYIHNKNLYNTKKKIMRKWNSSNLWEEKNLLGAYGISMSTFKIFQRGGGAGSTLKTNMVES